MNAAPPVDFHEDPMMLGPGQASIDFRLPKRLEANEPPEARGLTRDQVRLLVTYYRRGGVHHGRFCELPKYLERGDVLVLNTSGTLKAALQATGEDGKKLEIHMSTGLPADLWVVELRNPAPAGSEPYLDADAGKIFRLPGGASLRLLTPYRTDLREPARLDDKRVRLWIAYVDLPSPMLEYLDRYGFPIRYKYVRGTWPIEYYQTVYADEPGSAEMPSAGRAFTEQILEKLQNQGVGLAPIVLHTGVASLESNEPPYAEHFRVPLKTAQKVNQARENGGRVVAVGTTSVRALESMVDETGKVSPGEGWTELVITPERGLQSIDGLLTGFHEPRSSHLGILTALAGWLNVEKSYRTALAEKYLWHEFGDLHLILP